MFEKGVWGVLCIKEYIGVIYVAHSRVGLFGLINHELIRNKRKHQAIIDTSVFELLQIGLGWEGRHHDGTVYSLNGSGETIRINGKGKE